MNTPLFDTHPRETLTVSTDKGATPEIEKTVLGKANTILDKAAESLWWVINYFQSREARMETRRYRDARENDPDYGRHLRELEGDIGQSFHNTNYPPPPKSESWQNNKVLVGVAIAVISAAIISAVTTYTAVATLTTQMQMYIQANDKRLDGDESRIHDTERRLDRGAP